MSKLDFLNNLEKNTNLTRTENGALTNISSLNPLLDLFSLAGAMRNRSEEDIVNLLEKAIACDVVRSLKYVFYNGDIRGGLGERRSFRTLIRHLAVNRPELLEKNIHLIPNFNRWDAIYELVDTSLERKAFELVKEQLLQDLKSDKPSLCAKWLKSLNASSKESKILAKKTALALNLCNFTGDIDKKTIYKNEEKYRKVLSVLRQKINVVEREMAIGSFSNINYSNVPSKAMMNYQNAFMRKDEERYTKYLVDVALGDSKMNSKTLYPYEIVKKALNSYKLKEYEKIVLEAQWQGLPDYIDGQDLNSLCVVDVSGSMCGTPMEVAISLGLYCAERCSGAYKDKFITFSSKPTMETVRGNNIVEKVKNMESAEWGMNTNIEAVFELILQTALDNNSPQEDLPKNLIIISDMEMDAAMNLNDGYTGYSWRKPTLTKEQFESHKNTLFNSIENRYMACGYDMPNLIFWNVDARQNQSPMTVDKNGWCAVSGFSPSIFKSVLNGEITVEETVVDEATGEEVIVRKQVLDPIETMLKTLDSERYAEVVV